MKAVNVNRVQGTSSFKAKSLAMLVKTALLSLYCVAVLPAQSAPLNLSDLPLFVTSNVPPNLIVSMDDSGSMAWAFMPDSADDGTREYEIYYRSAHFNKAYYDPTITYEPPNNAAGAQEPDAVYTNAVRGYYYAAGFQVNVNLSNNFLALEDHYHSSQPDFLGPEEGGCLSGAGEPCNAQPAYYYNFDATNGSCDGTAEDADCYDKVVIDTDSYTNAGATNGNGRTLAEEQTNFANWYQFYAVRGDAAKTALMRSFTPESVASSVRVGRQTLNQITQVQSGAVASPVNRVGELDKAERDDFYDWVKSVRTSGGTPLRAAAKRAGDYYTTADAYKEVPGLANSPEVSCRLNTHILVTDGFYNGSVSSPSSFFRDDHTGTLPDGTSYTPGTANQHIYGEADNDDTNGPALADLIWHYWATDLRTGLANNLPPYFVEDIEGTPTAEQYWNPQNDPADWQHMTTYMVSFGLTGNVPFTDTVYNALLAGNSYVDNNSNTVSGWPSIGSTLGRADDGYHAGINGRGGFYNATDPNELVTAFKLITERIADRQATASTVVANSGRISSDNLVYLAKFNTSKWLGQLQAFDISDGSDFDPDGSGTGCNANAFGTLCGEAWDAADRITESSITHTTRNVISYQSTAAALAAPAGAGINFTWAALDATQQGLLNDGDGLGQSRLNYLRGDSSNEIDNGGVFKSRVGIDSASADGRLGPIVHSSPRYVGSGVDSNGLRQFDFPDNLEAGSYSAFLASISGRTPMIYVGGNDGMLHGINARRSGGTEVFAYVPNAVIDSLHELTEPTFQSGAFVDGPLAIQDLYTGGWRTMLVGGLRTGGKGYYALDITNPTGSATDIAMWEFTDANDADMGYSFGRAQLVRANNGQWVVIVSNGYNSTGEKAVLYVLDAGNGSVIKKFEVDATGGNGLSSPVAVSPDGDYNIDYVYAGDLKGNMWKFDMSSAAVGDWKFAKLFSAGTSRPITAAPTVGNHPANRAGRVVYFGTGKFNEPNDVFSSASQAFYGILDEDTCAGTAACVTNGQLVAQTIDGAGATLREVSDNNISWTANKGWKLTLSGINNAAERVTGRAFLIGPLVFFASIVPESDPCSGGGSSFLFAIDRNNGGEPEFPIFDTNNDGIVDLTDQTANDKNPASLKVSTDDPAPDITPLVALSKKKTDGCINIGGVCVNFDNAGRAGRIRWHQLK